MEVGTLLQQIFLEALNPQANLGGQKTNTGTFQEVPSLNPKGW